MDAWTAGWLIWIIVGLGLEAAALANRAQGDTLSEHVWKWFSIKDKGKWWQVRRFLLLAGMAWLTVHFLTGMWV